MDHPNEEPKPHLVGRLREALAEDPRSNTLDIRVTIAGGKVFLVGQVGSQELRRAAAQVVAEIVPPTLRVVNDLTVMALTETEEVEWME